MIKAIIFDCFGVVISDGLRQLIDASNGDKILIRQQINDWLDRSNKGLISAEESSKQIAEIFSITYEEYRNAINTYEVKDEALLGYIVNLRKKYKIALLSNIPKGSMARRFTEQETSKYFDVVVASGEVGYAKPEAQIYEITADRLGVRLDECVFTDDRLPYCEGAQAVGMQTLLYTDFSRFKQELEPLLVLA